VEKIDLVVVGPDNPLAEGIVDFLAAKDLRVFGPKKESAKLEWSKSYAKDFMTKHGIPTPRYLVSNSLEEAKQQLDENPWARVVKVDGLALGKGVFVCQTKLEAENALADIFARNKFGAAGNRVVLEEKVAGEELSLLLLCDGKRFVELESSQDHKRRFDGDKGPNTGGMGAYSPVPLYSQYRSVIRESIITPLMRTLEDKSLTYTGLLYVGIIIGRSQGDSADRVQVLEFNARFGDPEAQAILPRLTSDLLVALWAATEGKLDQVKLTWTEQPSCCVVAVTKEYPEKGANGDDIHATPLPENCFLFHAGTRLEDGRLLTSGGRILCVTGLGANLTAAAELAYKGLKHTNFREMDYRRDIARERSPSCR
jgi:phosphoribosylamine--glycine ligase